MTVRSCLSKFQPEHRADTDEVRAMAAAAWHRGRGLFVAAAEVERMGEADREALERIGAKLYGRRNSRR